MGLQTAQPTFIFTMPEHSSGIIKGYTSFPVGRLSLYFDISCCGKHGLWLFWSIWVQSPCEGPSWGRAGEISLGGQTWFWRELRSVLEERVGCTSKSLYTQFADSWEVVSLVTTTTRTILEYFLYVCFLVFSMCSEVKEYNWCFPAERDFFFTFVFFYLL